MPTTCARKRALAKWICNGSATVNIMVWLRSFVPMQNISTEMLNIVLWLLTYWGVRPHNNIIVAAAYCTSIPYKSPHSQKDIAAQVPPMGMPLYLSISRYIYVVLLLLVEKDRQRCSLQVPPKRSFSICRSMSLLLLCCTTIYSAMFRRIIMMFLWAYVVGIVSHAVWCLLKIMDMIMISHVRKLSNPCSTKYTGLN